VTLIVQYSDKGGETALFVPSSKWLQTTLVELAGGHPVWQEAGKGGGWTIVGFEQIAAWNPDKIFVVYYANDPLSIVESLKESSNWQELDAVISGDIHPFAGDFISWDQPDPRWILGYAWLAKMIHPEATAEIDLLEETTQFYLQVYGLDEKTIATQILPRLPFSDS
jgi:iron complex transport system substrate-binding protein